jgi:hypothetical protein
MKGNETVTQAHRLADNHTAILAHKWKYTPAYTFQPQGQTVKADSYCNILRKLRKAIQRKRPGLTEPGKSPSGSDSCPKNFALLVFRGL